MLKGERLLFDNKGKISYFEYGNELTNAEKTNRDTLKTKDGNPLRLIYGRKYKKDVVIDVGSPLMYQLKEKNDTLNLLLISTIIPPHSSGQLTIKNGNNIIDTLDIDIKKFHTYEYLFPSNKNIKKLIIELKLSNNINKVDYIYEEEYNLIDK